MNGISNIYKENKEEIINLVEKATCNGQRVQWLTTVKWILKLTSFINCHTVRMTKWVGIGEYIHTMLNANVEVVIQRGNISNVMTVRVTVLQEGLWS